MTYFQEHHLRLFQKISAYINCPHRVIPLELSIREYGLIQVLIPLASGQHIDGYSVHCSPLPPIPPLPPLLSSLYGPLAC
jgi:hypothetical protein